MRELRMTGFVVMRAKGVQSIDVAIARRMV